MGRPRRCPPCPHCGADAMRQYGARGGEHMKRYFYGCQTCQHTNVWREPVNGVPYWEKHCQTK